jgi:threonine/homoserine/homoserine lactone efflux protein
MDASAALIAGLVAGLAIAVQVGAVSVLLVETAAVAGPRAGVVAGMGVASADLAFAVVAVAAGGAAGAALAGHEAEIRLFAAATLAAIAIHGLIALRPDSERPGPAPAGGHYARFLAITVANPLTIASFAAVAVSLSLAGPLAAAAFAFGVGAASAAWHLVLGLAAGHGGRRLTPPLRRRLAVGGRIAVLAFAVHLATAA